MGERLTQVKFRDRIDIRRAGVPLYRDVMILKGDVATQMALPQTANGACALATIVSIAPEAEAQLSPVRDSLPETAGASLIRPDLLVIRILAEDSHELRRSLVPTLTCLRGKPLPRPWTL
jgi:urease accessory protein